MIWITCRGARSWTRSNTAGAALAPRRARSSSRRGPLVSRLRPVSGAVQVRLSEDAPAEPGSRPRSAAPRTSSARRRSTSASARARSAASTAAESAADRRSPVRLAVALLCRRRIALSHGRIPLGPPRPAPPLRQSRSATAASRSATATSRSATAVSRSATATSRSATAASRSATAASRSRPPRPGRAGRRGRCLGARPVPALATAASTGAAALVPLPLRHRDGAPGRARARRQAPGCAPARPRARRGLGRDQLRRPYLTFGVARPGRRSRRRRVGLFGPAARGAELLGGAQCLAGGRRRPLDGLGPLLARPLRLVLRPAGQYARPAPAPPGPPSARPRPPPRGGWRPRPRSRRAPRPPSAAR